MKEQFTSRSRQNPRPEFCCDQISPQQRQSPTGFLDLSRQSVCKRWFERSKAVRFTETARMNERHQATTIRGTYADWNRWTWENGREYGSSLNGGKTRKRRVFTHGAR